MKLTANDLTTEHDMEITFLCRCGSEIKFTGEQITTPLGKEVGNCVKCLANYSICFPNIFSDIARRYSYATPERIIMRDNMPTVKQIERAFEKKIGWKGNG